MQVLSQVDEIRSLVREAQHRGARVGVVPTMGALHAGHLSLVERARRECEHTVTTIFVNPSQFGPNEDFSRYPRTLQSDLDMLEAAGCDWVFVPTNEQMYPPGHSTFIEPPAVAAEWEGRIRPGHFRGVATIVLKLFHAIPADVAYFGRKDYQQVAVLKAMVRDLNLGIDLVACETVREPDGLAMSSRNRYLSPGERQRALGLSQALQRAQSLVTSGCRDSVELEAAMREMLQSAPVDSIDYAAIVDPDTMVRLQRIDRQAVAILAARIGSTRLIDNATLRVEPSAVP